MFQSFIIWPKRNNFLEASVIMLSRKFTKILLSATAMSFLSACAVVDKKDTAEESNWFVRLFEKDGQNYAEQATLYYSRGNFAKTLEYTTEALKDNPRNQQALLVGALAAEKLGRYNRARQYYEDLIIINGNETSLLGSSDGQPRKITEIAKDNLRAITIAQNKLTVENRDGSQSFTVSDAAGADISKNTITEALRKKSVPAVRTQPAGIDDIFTPEQQNIVSRFLILKELAEKDFITKEEFLSRRQANIGGLLPLTNPAPGTGITDPVPSPDLIIERLNILKEGVATRAITPREFSAERDVIIEALMSPAPRQRIKNKAPAKNILDAAHDLRQLEVLYDLDLITANEKLAEKKAVEKYLGIRRDHPKPVVAAAPQPAAPQPPAPSPAPKAEPAATTAKDVQTVIAEELAAKTDTAAVTPAAAVATELQAVEIPPAPQVSSPF